MKKLILFTSFLFSSICYGGFKTDYLQVTSSATNNGPQSILGAFSVNPYLSGNGLRTLYFDPNSIDGVLHINQESGGSPRGAVQFETFGSTSAFLGRDGSNNFIVKVTTPGNALENRISIGDNNNATVPIKFNENNKGFTLEQSSITFLNGTKNPILDWSRPGNLRLTNSSFTVTQINWADGTVQVSSPVAGGGGGTPGGSNKQLQYNNNGSFGGINGATYTANGSPMIAIQSQSASTVPFVVQGAVSQTGDLTEWKDSAGNVALSITADGTKITTPQTSLTLEQTGDVFGTTSLTLESRNGQAGPLFKAPGLDVLDFGFQTANTADQWAMRTENRAGVTASGAGGAFPEVQLFWSGSGFPAFATFSQNGSWVGNRSVGGSLINANTISQFMVENSIAANIGLVVKAAASQSTDIIETQDSSTNLKWGVDKNGYPFPPSRTKAQLSTDVPSKAGLEAYCSDCSIDGIVISTGTAAGSWGKISARTTVIN